MNNLSYHMKQLLLIQNMWLVKMVWFI